MKLAPLKLTSQRRTELSKVEVNSILGNYQKEAMISQINETVHAAGHDVRAPIFIVRGYTHILQKSNKSNPDNLRKLDMIMAATHKMEKLVNALVLLNDYQTKDYTDIHPIKVDALFEKAKYKLMRLIDQAAPEIIQDFSKGNEIFFSKTQLSYILKQLLSNAIYHNAKQPDLKIKISTKSLLNGVELTIEDNGIGMDLNYGEEQLYKPFYRHSNDSNLPGVGLTIVKTILNKTNGSIQIFSKANKGTKCIVKLTHCY